MHSLWLVQWDLTRRDHPGNLGRVSGLGPVIYSGDRQCGKHLLQDTEEVECKASPLARVLGLVQF